MSTYKTILKDHYTKSENVCNYSYDNVSENLCIWKKMEEKTAERHF